MNRIQLSSDVSFPLSFVTNTTAVLARRGAGKSYTASVIAEQVMEAEQPVIILDPLGAFWGLRSSADGKKAGFAVIVLGGRHGDVPLEPTAGKVIAALVVDKPGWYVLDLSLFESGAAQDRFAADFLEALYRLKAGKPTAQLLIIDEADSFAPQRPGTNQLHMLGAMESIVRRGRSRGLGMVMISQRAAVLNKNVLTQAENLIIMQTTGPQDLAAVELWIQHSGQDGLTHKVMGSLPSLGVGDAWVWSPQHEMLERTHIQKRKTFDSSATPKPGETRVEPRERADVDLEALGAEIKATVERAKENDPAELKAKVRRLEAELAKKPTPQVERHSIPILSAEAENKLSAAGLELSDLENAVVELVERVSAVRAELTGIGNDVKKMRDISSTKSPDREPDHVLFRREVMRKKSEQIVTQAAGSVLGVNSPLTPPLQKILAVVWMLGERGLTPNREMVARWLDLHPKGGTYNTNLGYLRNNGYLAGFEFQPKAADQFTVLRTGLDAALEPLDGGQRRIMEFLRDHNGHKFSRQSLAEGLELHHKGGTFNTNIGRLRTMGLIPERGDIYLTEAAYR